MRVAYINDELVLNPTMAQLDESQMEVIVASTSEKIVMLEAGAREVSEDLMNRAIVFGHQANQEIIRLQDRIREALGKPKAEMPAATASPDVEAAISPLIGEKLAAALSHQDKAPREEALADIGKELVESIEEFGEEEIMPALDKKVRAEIRNSILERGRRVSGRGLTEIRPLDCQVSLLPRTHGSGLFTRGQTQVLTITTLGSTRKEQQLDGLGIEETKRFIHHYNMPPFSNGEVRRIGSTSRREIGHGALVERSLHLPHLIESRL